jgi:hypothetical protein
VKVVVTGRANVGKSSLLNSVIGRRDLLFTSKKAVSRYGLGAVFHYMLVLHRAEPKHSTFSVLDHPLVAWSLSTLRDMVPGADLSGVPFSTII